MGIISEDLTERMDFSRTLKEAQKRTVLSLGKNKSKQRLRGRRTCC